MSYNLPHLPKRQTKPRERGITMVIDKGLSIRQAEDMIHSAGKYVDFVKLGFGTALITSNLKEKIKYYQQKGIRVFLGGTLFEAFAIRDKISEYKEYVNSLGLDTVEISNGAIEIPLNEKCQIINDFSKDMMVLSEVGTKLENKTLTPNQWISSMKAEIEAGSWMVIAEARESGTVGIYNKDNTVDIALIQKISESIDIEKVMWEAPLRSQQVDMVELFGAEVNLGNILPNDTLALEALRLGLRGDTILNFLPEEIKVRAKI